MTTEIFEYATGRGTIRYVVATWNDQNGQYESSDLPESRQFQGYVKTFARSVGELVALGIRSYATIGEARSRAAGESEDAS